MLVITFIQLECMSLCLHQRTALDVAVERGYANIAEVFQKAVMPEVSV